MKIFSRTHALTALMTAFAVAPKGSDGKPLAKTALVQAPLGTVIELDDDEAQKLVDEGLAEEFKEGEHEAVKGVVPVTLAQRVAPETLPEGQTRPTVVRQDETLNDGRVMPAPGAKVIGDTRENDARAEEQAKADAAAKAAADAAPK